jgi:GH25 family lysozyme M1 (1,4-beta-N-acetylmuramidase)
MAMLGLGLGMLAGPGRALAQRPLGIDVSHYQGAGINWSNVKSSGVTFAWAKASEGTNFVDADFTINEANAKAAGVLIGAYHYADFNLNTGTNGAASEAAHFWSVARNYVTAGGAYLMPMLDVEAPTTNSTVTSLSQWVNQWCLTVSNNAAAAGVLVKPVIYVSSSFADEWFNSTVAQWTPWIAEWPASPNPQTGAPSPTTLWSTWVFWQYADSSSNPGDADVFNGTASGLAAYVIGSLGAPPGITNQPVSQTVLAGANATFTVGASGTAPLSYQWRFNGGKISGATASSFTTNNIQAASAGSYSVVVTNAYGSTNSANAVLTVNVPPVITVQPTNVFTGLGLNPAFSVTAAGTAPLSYQWRFNGGHLTGAMTNTLTIANAQTTNAGTYTVWVTNLYGTVLSSNAVLQVLDPYIANQPQNQTVAAGAPAAFSVGAVGTAPLSYAWSKNAVALADGGNISGSATPTLSLASVQAGDQGTYSVTVSNLNGSVVSSDATLVAGFPPTITSQPASQQVLAGATVSLGITETGLGPVTYQWQNDGTNLADGGAFSGSATASLSVSNIQAGQMGNYSVVVSNAYGAVTSSNALVTLWPLVDWGADTYGQANVPGGLSNVVTIAGGLYHSLVARADGTVAAWGAGTTNAGTGVLFGQAIVPGGLSNVVAVAGGDYHSLALRADGTMVAWGAGTTNAGISPHYGQSVIPGGLSNVTAIAAGGYHSLALKTDGTVAAWGAGTNYIGSSPNYGQSLVPAGLTEVVAVAAGSFHSLALKTDGTVVAWGAGTNTGSPPNYGQALVPAGLTGIVAIAAGGFHSLALKADGTVVAWGAGTTNTGAVPNFGQALVPGGLSNVVAIAGGLYHSLALKTDGTVVIWGAGTNNTGTKPNYGQALVPAGVANVIALAGGGVHTLVLEGNGSPSLTAQPASQTVTAGVTEVYAALAVGSQPLSYQWQFDGTNIAGATQSAYSLASAQPTDAGTYSVVVSNAYGVAVSSHALLTVLLPTSSQILTAPAFVANGLFQFNLAGAAGSNYVIEASTNLTDWTPLETNVSPFTFTDTNAVNLPLRFYRARGSP